MEESINPESVNDPIAEKLHVHQDTVVTKDLLFRHRKLARSPHPTALPPMRPSEIYTTFSGADIIISLNDIQVGAVSDFSWEKVYGPSEGAAIKGTLTCTVFQHTMEPLIQYPYNTLSVTFANEYGNAMHLGFVGVRFIKRRMAASMEDIVVEEVYDWVADEVDEYSIETIVKK